MVWRKEYVGLYMTIQRFVKGGEKVDTSSDKEGPDGQF